MHKQTSQCQEWKAKSNQIANEREKTLTTKKLSDERLSVSNHHMSKFAKDRRVTASR